RRSKSRLFPTRRSSDLGGSKYEPGRISVSPDTIKFMVTSITGGAGKFVSDAVTGTMGVANGIAPTLKDTPIVRRFARESGVEDRDRKSTRLNSSHVKIS